MANAIPNEANIKVLQETWKALQDHTLQEGCLSNQASTQAVKALIQQIGVNIKEASWDTSLQDLLKAAAQSKDVSSRVAAAGIARSIAILGTWGAYTSASDKERAICMQARKVAESYLRSLTRNFLVQFADWIRQHIETLLLRRSLLPCQFQDAYRRKIGHDARQEDGFDAVISFGDAGIGADLENIDNKLKHTSIAWWQGLLLKIERFLHDVLSPSLSASEDVARLQMQWRLLTREIDPLLKEIHLDDAQNKKLKNYVWQFNWVKRVLEAHFKQHHWDPKESLRPVFHIKRAHHHKQTVDDIVQIVQNRATDLGLLGPTDNMFVVQVS